MQIRPTSDRLRETLFNVLAPRIEGARFLDLCAGSGAIGIEALSRGASFVTFVDRSRKMCGLVEANLDLCEVPENETTVVLSEASEFLRRAATRNEATWDIAFFDPPYALDYSSVLTAFGEGSLLTQGEDGNGGLLVIEHHHKNQLREEAGQLRRWRILKQGDSCLSFYNYD